MESVLNSQQKIQTEITYFRFIILYFIIYFIIFKKIQRREFK